MDTNTGVDYNAVKQALAQKMAQEGGGAPQDPSQAGGQAPDQFNPEEMILKALISRLNKYPVPGGDQPQAPAQPSPDQQGQPMM